MSETIRVDETVAITATMGTDTPATMSVEMHTSFLTVDKNCLVKPMFVQSVFPRDRLKVMQLRYCLQPFMAAY